MENRRHTVCNPIALMKLLLATLALLAMTQVPAIAFHKAHSVRPEVKVAATSSLDAGSEEDDSSEDDDLALVSFPIV